MKAGNYVRYKYENCIYIGKIKFISEVMGFEETLQLDIDTCMEEILKEDVIKSSSNIIDLIEVGDIVVIINGLNEEELILIKDLKREKPILESHKIKSILTKEMFSNVEYRVENN